MIGSGPAAVLVDGRCVITKTVKKTGTAAGPASGAMAATISTGAANEIAPTATGVAVGC